MAVGKRLRFEVFKRDRFTCQYCGRTPPSVVLHVDHVIPQSDGGPDTETNLVTACEGCNQGKSNIPLTEVTKTVAEQMERTRERREQVEALNRLLAEERDAEDAQIEELGTYWYDLIYTKKGRYVFGDDRARSIRTFLKKLPAMSIKEAIDIAASRVRVFEPERDDKRWKYFCGVCWGKIRELETAD